MSIELDRLKARFDSLFQDDGLDNIKFFVRSSADLSKASFVTELNAIQDTIAAGDFESLDELDTSANSVRFDTPF